MSALAILRVAAVLCIPSVFSQAIFSQSVTVSPTSVSFGNQAQGTTSPVRKVTLKNGQTSAITISSVSTTLADFGETNNCPATLAAGASCTISVTFTPSAQGTRSGTLTVVDTGLSSPQTVSLTGTGTAAILKSIAVTPNPASVLVALTQQFTATGTYTDGSTQILTTSASWASSSAVTATVGLHTGLATGVAAGTATITAASGTIKGTATLTVTAAVLTSISVTPATASIAAGKTKQFTATGTYNNGTTKNITTTATWTSSSASVATVSTAGLATGVAIGSATITATSGTISGSATLTVTAATLTSIAVTPSSVSIATGSAEQFTATGTYSDGSTKSLTTTASWTSSSTSVATVGLHTGLATALTKGTTTITATSGAIKGTATLTVTASLVSIAVSPANPTIAKGNTQQFSATGTYSDGSTQDLTGSATWSSSQTSVATVVAGGLATGTGIGASTITATSGTVSGSTTLNVAAAVLVSIAVTPANSSFALGTTLPFTATGTYSDGSTLNVTASVTWTTADATIATVNSQGVASSVGGGGTTVTATLGTIVGSTSVTVTPATLVSIAVTPAIPTIAAGATQQFTATGTYTDNSTQNITSTVQWNSDTPTVATISNTAGTGGLATGVMQGTATISATSGSITGSTTLTVTSTTLVSIAVNPANPSIAPGLTLKFTATGTYSDGSTQDLTGAATWSSDSPTTATINTSGLATSVGQGTATISATSGAISGSTSLTVTSAALVSIAINPSTTTIALGTTQQFTATGTYSDGSVQDLTQSGQWSSTAATVATISDTPGTTGLASSTGVGTTTINITSGTVTGSATLVVNPAALVSIAVAPQNATIDLGASQQFTATGTYTDGSTQDLTTVVTWSSSDATIAIISNAVGSYGLATSSGQGTATISATSGSVAGSTSLTVSSAGLVSIAVAPVNPTISAGGTQQFTATGTYADSSSQNITSFVTWASGTQNVATISNSSGSKGLASGISPGTANISATSGSITSAATMLTVIASGPTLTSISVTPASVSIPLGSTQQFTATGNYSDGTTQNITASITWTSSTTAVAVISNASGTNGFATGAGVGTTTITATLGSVSGSTTLSVTGAIVSFSPSSLTFGNQGVGTTSIVETVTLSNTGNASLSITSIAVTASYSETSNCGSNLAAGAGCSISITFSPTIAGTMSGSVTVTDSASNSPQTVGLTGTGQLLNFQHVIVIVQENRTPDNFFQGLCSSPFGTAAGCSVSPTGSQYDIQTSSWLDKTSSSGVTQPTAIPLNNNYDPDHGHNAFLAMCDLNSSGACQMDGAALDGCVGGTPKNPGPCPPEAQMAYVDNSTSVMNPYLTLATEYGWANYMFQTNQGASFPAHQFLFAGTSAPNASDDAIGTFVADNVSPNGNNAGCIAQFGTVAPLITPQGETQTIYPCLEHQTMADLLDSINVSWKYYTPSAGSIWTAPDAISHICVPSAPTGGVCTGTDWTNDVVMKPAQVLTDVSNCKLPQVSWVIPTGANSDHPSSNTGGGPSWVASVVNAIGTNPQCGNGETYWNNTAILITWDDWGGWYDHEPPTILQGAQGDYQYGFRVPFIVVSAYTPAAYIDNTRMDFGSILRFIENNFGITEGSLNFADARASTDLTEFFNLEQVPRPFVTIPARLDANYFLNDKTPPTDPDDY